MGPKNAFISCNERCKGQEQPRGGRCQKTRNVHLHISENVPPKDRDGRPGSCISVTHDLPFRIEIRRLNGRALLFVERFVIY